MKYAGQKAQNRFELRSSSRELRVHNQVSHVISPQGNYGAPQNSDCLSSPLRASSRCFLPLVAEARGPRGRRGKVESRLLAGSSGFVLIYQSFIQRIVAKKFLGYTKFGAVFSAGRKARQIVANEERRFVDNEVPVRLSEHNGNE